jgi:hypothetical protein
MAIPQVCIDSTGRAYSAVRDTSVSGLSKWLRHKKAEASRVSRRDSINSKSALWCATSNAARDKRELSGLGDHSVPTAKAGTSGRSHGDKG